MKKLLTLTLAMALATTSLVFASENTTANTTDIIAVIQSDAGNPEAPMDIADASENESIKITRSSYVAVNQTLTSSTWSETVSFDTTKSYPYFRVYINNTSSVSYKTVVAGKSYTVPAKSAKTIYSTAAASPNTYKVSITSTDGSKLQGSVSVRVAQNITEVQP